METTRPTTPASVQQQGLPTTGRWLLWILFLALLLCANMAQAQGLAPLPTKGREFWMGYMQNAYGAQELRVQIASQNGTSGTVSTPRTGWSSAFTVAANGVTTLIVPVGNEHTGSEVLSDKGVLIQANDSVTVSLESFQSFTTDGAQVFPTEALGTSYRAQSYRGLPGFADFYKSELLIVATQDDTEIEIVPSVNTSGGRAAGVPFIVSLDAGQSYQVQSALASLDVTGTTVRATTSSGPCRPFAVFSGSMCANVPAGCPACDHIVEQMVPTDRWGQNFHTIPLTGAITHTYRILADQNSTTVTIDGGAPILLNAGQSHLVNGASVPVCISADKPVSVAQLMEGFNCATTGDPSMIELMPDERVTTSVVFSTVTSPQIAQHSVSVIMSTANIGQLLLDGSPVSTSLFQPFTACNSFSHAKVTIPAGTHRLSATGGFLAYAMGAGTGESYAFTLSSKAIAGTPNDSTICSAGPLVLNAPLPITNAEWTAASAPSVVVGTGPSYAFTPTTNDSYTVNGEVPGSGCPVTFTYHVGLPVQPVLTLTANNLPSATVCQFGAVQLNVAPTPDPNAFDLLWSPGTVLSDPTIVNPIAYPQANTWFRLNVTSPVGCGSVTDSIFVSVLPSGLMSVKASANDSAVCSGEQVLLNALAEQMVVSDAFNGAFGSMWSSVLGAAVNNTCGSVSGDALYFNGNTFREARTTALNMSNGGAIRFALKIATGTAPCDNADPGENVVLEYSLNNGGSWSAPFATFNENAYPAFIALNVAVPAAAQSAATLFRWRQLSHGGAGQDNWAIDDVIISQNSNTGLSFAWSPSAGLATPNAASTTTAPTASTTYAITASTANGCTAQDDVQVVVQPAFQVFAGNDTTLCTAGATVALNATVTAGNVTGWSWTPANGSLSNAAIGNPTATPTATTTYTVTATTDIGCTDSDAMTITVGNLSGLTVSSTDTQLCPGEDATLSAVATGAGLFTYAWSPASGLNNAAIANPTAQPGATTNYTCLVTEPASGCQRSASITLHVNGPYSVNATTNDTLCSTLGFQLNVVHSVPAPFTILWSNGQFLNSSSIASPTIIADTTATYLVTVTDVNGCSFTDSSTIISAWDNLVTPINLSACVGTAIPLDAGYPGSAYLWNTGATTQTISATTNGQYTAEITDPMGCVTVKNYFLTFNPLPSVNLGPDLSLCGATNQVLNANSPGNAVLWSGGQTTQQISVTQSATYSVLVTSPQGCQNGDAISVTFNPMPVDVLQDITTCVSTPVTLNAGNAGSTYMWNAGTTTQSIGPTQSGTYSVVVTNAQGCSGTFNAVVTFMPLISVDLGSDTTLCAGQTLSLDAGNNGATYLWSNGATTQTISPSQNGTYSVTASNGFCLGTDAISVSFDPIPLDVLQNVTACVDQTVTLNAGNAGCSYLWNTGATTSIINPTTSGNYSVVVTNSTNCSITADATVTLVGFPVVDLGPDSVLCEGDVLTLDAGNPGASYTWSSGQNTRTLDLTSGGTYTVTVNNGYCTSSDAFTATFNPSPTRFIDRKFYTCLDEAPGYVVINAGNEGSEYDWSTGETSQVILAGAYGWYYVQVTNVHDCATRDSAEVIEFCPATLYVPNTFTPNGDGTNDIWMPVGKNIGEYSVQVFDRWGGIIFQSNDPQVGWDGTMSGEYVKNDVYVWRMEYTFLEDESGQQGRLHKELGHVTVMR
ncbi:MAG: gliding motility-associated C-terminal domain-containing protein [Flavobacteriales bacterium]|nr:gliding motility-associated C-terminal domain-containing protein [Flavobacteriales bacterium]MBL0036145.1 gliding motility-associated C-terminal domain-containing protein [Flavobacteriales bacterium]